MVPYDDNNPESSHYICMSKFCMQLHDGKLWKCPSLAYLDMQLAKTGQLDDPAYTEYLKYKPIHPDCTDEELGAWLEVNQYPESFCRMCPASHDVIDLKIGQVIP